MFQRSAFLVAGTIYDLAFIIMVSLILLVSALIDLTSGFQCIKRFIAFAESHHRSDELCIRGSSH